MTEAVAEVHQHQVPRGTPNGGDANLEGVQGFSSNEIKPCWLRWVGKADAVESSIRGHFSSRCRCWTHRAALLLAIVTHTSLLACAVMEGDSGATGDFVDMARSTVAFACFFAFELLRRDSARGTRQAIIALFLMWLEAVLELGRPMSGGSRWPDALLQVLDVLWAPAILAFVYHRLVLAEQTFGQYFGSSYVLSIAVLTTALSAVTRWHQATLPGQTHFLVNIATSCLVSAVAMIMCAAVAVMHKAVCFRVTQPGSALESEAKWAKHVFLSAGLAATAAPVAYAAYWQWGSLFSMGTELDAFARMLLSVVVLFCFLLICSVIRLPPAKRTSRSDMAQCLLASGTPRRSDEWISRVGELAGRSIELAELLRFYYSLGKSTGPMPHYDPLRHTTNDVVRQAIIPMTRTTDGGGVAYADLNERSLQKLPCCMVTHSWSNLFLHLVAAVVAEALELEEFAEQAAQLAAQSSEGLEDTLRAKGKANHRYWICAFCVNQHTSICSRFNKAPPVGTPEYLRWDRNRRDSVTGQIFPHCLCTEPKHLNDNSPDKCELNKFDAMMEQLQERVPGFRQLVAVDKDFNIFSRIWCIAELVQAHTSGIPQTVCICSNEVLDLQNEDLSLFVKLATLTATECSASRQADKDEILAKISDVDEFDAQLQVTIFGERGFLQQHVVGLDVLDAAARSARRVLMVCRKLEERCSCGEAVRLAA